GTVALETAAEGGHYEVMRLLLQRPGPACAPTPLAFGLAARSGNIAALQLLLEAAAAAAAAGGEAGAAGGAGQQLGAAAAAAAAAATPGTSAGNTPAAAATAAASIMHPHAYLGAALCERHEPCITSTATTSTANTTTAAAAGGGGGGPTALLTATPTATSLQLGLGASSNANPPAEGRSDSNAAPAAAAAATAAAITSCPSAAPPAPPPPAAGISSPASPCPGLGGRCQDRLDVLQWLEARGCPVGDEAQRAEALSAAAMVGSRVRLEWMRARGFEWSARAFTTAAASGCIQLVEWMVKQGCPMGRRGDALLAAAANSDSAMLAALRRLGCPWSADVLPRAVCGVLPLSASGEGPGLAVRCRLRVLRWMVAHGCPVTKQAYDVARTSGRYDVAEWLKHSGLLP
ncbi:hypothetical protein Agub_g5788, partial [Astrephomene gubernaculifera]